MANKKVSLDYLKKWTLKKLKARALELHSSINQAECFGTRDLLEFTYVTAELYRRGYETHETRTLSIVKAG